MQLPRQLIKSLEGIKGFDREAFETVHAIEEQVTSVRINPVKWSERELTAHPPFTVDGKPGVTRVPWSRYGYYLKERPSFTFDPLFHAGCYYVQEASSMFLEQGLSQVVDLSKPLKILDLCAAPGGKSTHIQSLISKDSLLVGNEVIKSRATILKENSIKWGSDNVVVTNNDPRDFARLADYFDVIVVDAPCSGSGLFRRDEEAIAEWSENNVLLCSQRQQRILADVWPALKQEGILVYSTCSYSEKENEAILDWILRELKAESLQLATGKEWNITEVLAQSGAYGYRFWPDKTKGEGFFTGCFRKKEGGDEFSGSVKRKLATVGKKETQLINSWVEENNYWYGENNNIVYALPAALAENINILLTTLRVQYSGIIVGEIFGKELVPAHALAMSRAVNGAIPQLELDYKQAIHYLQKKDFDPGTKEKGWQLVTYSGHNLGWVKALSNRINNYYPKELRILKDI